MSIEKNDNMIGKCQFFLFSIELMYFGIATSPTGKRSNPIFEHVITNYIKNNHLVWSNLFDKNDQLFSQISPSESIIDGQCTACYEYSTCNISVESGEYIIFCYIYVKKYMIYTFKNTLLSGILDTPILIIGCFT